MFGLLRDFLHRISLVLRFPLYLMLSLLPSDPGIWVFTAGDGDTFLGNTKYLFLYLHEDGNIDPRRPVWISNDPRVVERLREAGYEAHQRSSLRGRVLLARAGVACLTHGNPLWPYTANSSVVQTWHGVGIKTMGREEPGEVTLSTEIYRKYVFENWDYFVVTGSDKPASKYRQAFDLHEDQILSTGLPRNDALFRRFDGMELIDNQTAIDRFQELSDAGPLVCYLPTWRRGHGKQAGVPLESSHLDLSALDTTLERADANLVIKPHPMASFDLGFDGFDHVHVLEDVADLYAVLEHVDVLVTDYSSVFVDYLLLDRPLVFFTYDLDEYRHSRGFAFDFSEHAPGPRAESTEDFVETVEAVLAGIDEHGPDRAQVRREFHDHCDGNACRRLANRIMQETGSKG